MIGGICRWAYFRSLGPFLEGILPSWPECIVPGIRSGLSSTGWYFITSTFSWRSTRAASRRSWPRSSAERFSLILSAGNSSAPNGQNVSLLAAHGILSPQPGPGQDKERGRAGRKVYDPAVALPGTPDYIRSDNGSEFTANAVRSWLKDIGVTTLYIEPGSPWENGYVESYLGKLRDELLNGEILDTLMEAKVLVEGWRQEYNRFRPHSSLGYRAPAQEAK